MNPPTRRRFLKNAALAAAAGAAAPLYSFNIIHRPQLIGPILGHGDFTYRLEQDWGKLDASQTPVKDCHEMVQDAQGRLFLLTNHAKNNVIIYDASGKLLGSWTLQLKAAHGLSIHDEGGEQFLYITDTGSRGAVGKVLKTTLDGRVIMELPNPRDLGVYRPDQAYKPTETAIGPKGDIYVADGYGSQFVLQFNQQGEFIRKFGGDSFLRQDAFKQAHGVTLDVRDPENPSLICTARIKCTLKRFSLEGEWLEDFYLPGAFMSRAVIHGDELYTGVCFGMTPDNFNMQMNLGFVSILDKRNRVVSNPGGTPPIYKANGALEPLYQAEPIFKHCHDVCVDRDKNLYVCQWNAGKVYPYKLHRI